MIRVLEFATRFEIGGSEGQLVRLLERLDRTRFEPHAACLRRTGALVAPLEAAGIPISEYRCPHLYGLTALVQQRRFAGALHRDHIDVVHALGFYTNVFAIPAARMAHVPVVIGSIREQSDQWTTAQSAVNRAALALADCVVVNAVSVHDELVAHGFTPHKVRVIRNGVDVERFSLPRKPGGLREELGWPPGTPIVCVVSRVNPKKGIEEFLEAARSVSAASRDVRFLIVGDGSIVVDGEVIASGQRRLLEARAAELGLADRVCFTGFRIDVPQILSQVDVAVVPSRSEALSNSLLEAMAAGAPVIATRVGDHPLVVEDGLSGQLVPPGDADAIAHAVLQLLGDRARASRLGEAARRTARTRFSLERMVKETEALYEELLDRKRPVVAVPPRLEVETVTDVEGLRALAPEWTALHDRVAPDHPFSSYEWVDTWWQAFGAGRKLEILVVRRGRECVAIAPFMREHTRMYRVPAEQLALLGNDHTPRNDVLCADPAAYEALIAHLSHSPWDVLVLPQIPDGSPTIDTLSRVGADHHVHTGLWIGSVSPVLRLAGDHASFERALPSKMRQNLRNKARRIAELGPVTMETITGGPEVAAAVADGIRLEAVAWKSENGTAILSSDEVQRFYTLLAEPLAARGWLELRFLKLGDRRIAFTYSIRYRGTLFVLKQGYDGELSRCSPGLLFWQRIIEQGYRDGLSAIDFLGDDEDWKLSWGAELRRHYWLFGFRNNPRSRLLHALKFGVAPALRDRAAHAAANAHA